MDIAKIRKKLKDLESRQPAVEGETPGIREENPSDNQMREPESIQKTVPEPEPVIAGPETSGVKNTSGREQNPAAHSPERVKEEARFNQGTGPDAKENIQYKEKKESEDRDETDKTDEVIEILTFKLFEEEFAFRISQLKEILRYQRITKVPKMPDYVLGITSLRGKVIPVIDLRTKILPHENVAEIDEKIKILIIKGPKGMIGAVIDKLIGVMRIAKADILPPPTHLSEEQLKFIEGIAVLEKRFISIINMEEAITINLN
ncbi:MAG: chemotaxis protein CheW [Thermodesulfovibrionales bacterium]|jgi:purine-binding chemotaxis protein CheW